MSSTVTPISLTFNESNTEFSRRTLVSLTVELGCPNLTPCVKGKLEKNSKPLKYIVHLSAETFSYSVNSEAGTASWKKKKQSFFSWIPCYQEESPLYVHLTPFHSITLNSLGRNRRRLYSGRRGHIYNAHRHTGQHSRASTDLFTPRDGGKHQVSPAAPTTQAVPL